MIDSEFSVSSVVQTTHTPTRSHTRILRFLLMALLLVFGFGASARARVLLQGFYWDVPSPAAGSLQAPWWWDHLASQARSFQDAGFTAIWLPPVMKGNSGGYSVGYDPFDDYDLGSRFQKGTVPLRYGNREQLERCVAALRAAGLDVVIDLVENHRNGDPGDFVFRYRDAWGRLGGGRFPKGPLDFHPNVPQDPDTPDDGHEISFGRDLAPINGERHWIFNGLIAGGDWLTRALDVQGYRLDDVKGISTDWLRPFLNRGAMHDNFAVGEFWDGDRNHVERWVRHGMRSRSSAFDFPLRDLLKQMCDAHGYFDMAKLDHTGLVGIDPEHAVTFVENHDTDRSAAITNAKLLAYAYILTSEGYPSIFYKDWSNDPGCRGLAPLLAPLIRIHETLAFGRTVNRWKDRDALVFERTGGRHLLAGFNDNERDGQSVQVQTGFGPHRRLHDYSGHAPDLWTEARGRAKLRIPPNRNGLGFVCYSVAGLRLDPTAPLSRRVHQVYEGAPDLDIPPAAPGQDVPVCRIWPARESMVTARLLLTNSHQTWPPVTLEAVDLAGKIVARSGGPSHHALHIAFRSCGDGYTLRVVCATARRLSRSATIGGTFPYRLAVTYLGGGALEDLPPLTPVSAALSPDRPRS